MTNSQHRRALGNALGQFLPKVTKKAFEKYGFATASLATDWAMIVGDDLAAKATPERISWPRLRHGTEDDPQTGCGRKGATLVLRVRPAFAIEVQYAVGAIADRVNSYFGYRAIEKIRIHQGEFASQPADAARPRDKRPACSQNPAAATASLVSDVSNDRLKSALERLASNVGQG